MGMTAEEEVELLHRIDDTTYMRLPDVHRWLAIKVEAAVLVEREACAKLAEHMGSEDYSGDGKPADGGEIGAAIRCRK